jgi:hypothetical protein
LLRLKVLCELDPNPYPKGVAATTRWLSLNLARVDFHGEWNYTIKPRANRNEAVVS